MARKDRLIILDLDHTLIYASYAESETASLLCEYDELLTIYERPYVREFISTCKNLGDVIVYTLSDRDYADLVCDKLNIKPLEIIAGLGGYLGYEDIQKSIKSSWYKKYRDIVVIDDSPELWRSSDRERARFIVPPEFMGDASDDALRYINLVE
jgi:TFIIF-interacting CTD phosphatase-like protein